MSKLDETVYTIDGTTIKQHLLRDLLATHVEYVPRHAGVDTKYYLAYSRGYAVARWDGFQTIVSRHRTRWDAMAALEDIWINEIDHSDPKVFWTLQAAQDALADLMDEQS